MYIVNPAWFYIIELLGTIKGVLGVISVLSGIGVVVGVVILAIVIGNRNSDRYTKGEVFSTSEYDGQDGEIKTYDSYDLFKKMLKRITIVFLVSVSVFSLIPQRDTMYKMLIASFITRENLEEVKEVGKDLHDYLVNDMSTAVDKLTDSAIKVKESGGNK
jgi:hypothetical protein